MNRTSRGDLPERLAPFSLRKFMKATPHRTIQIHF
jgi:hypothetical protein